MPDQHALVTGAARGIGAATCHALAAAGYAITALDLIDPAETVARIEKDGGVASAVVADVRDRAAVRAAVSGLDRLDAVVTCAGVYGTGTRLEDLEEDDVDLVLDVNLKGTLWTLQATVPHLRATKGRVVCFGSLAGRNGGVLAGPHYSASKGGVHAVVRWLSKAEAGNGVRVNGIAPGPIDTPMIDGKGYTPDSVPLARFGRSDEMAAVAAFLVSPASSFMTGAVVDANGGIYVS
jgi:3-oxoacyl-[acyl-carrier protein] reductase